MSDFPSFVDFFRALWDRDPFPWQTMLAERVAAGRWPDAINLPTASGKTACLDIAVWALAAQVGRENRTAARRVWFVVDRRIVVDEAYERALKIATKLESAHSAVLWVIADRLLDLRGLPRRERPLAVGRLRGGVLRDDSWARLPSQAAIITSTVDQLGSRLLFRGYGHSALAAPIYAGLAANDSLILLDEAHCANPFLQTLRAVKVFRSEKWSEIGNPTPFHVAVLSATPPGEDDSEKPVAFPGDENERVQALDHPVLQARLTASKRAVLEEAKDPEALAEKIAAAAQTFARSGALRVGVIVNRVDRAVRIAGLVGAKARDSIADGASPAYDVALLTGRIRAVDREWLVGKNALLHRQLRANDPEKLVRPLILVSTQCLEVGADFSFDALVTECTSLDALRQRFGRLARLGKPYKSPAVIFAAQSALKESDPIYGEALAKTWEFLWSKACNEERIDGKRKIKERVLDFGFEVLRGLLPPPDSDELRDLLAPSPDAPILLPAHLDLLCQTSPRPHPDPDIDIFLHGKGHTAAEVRVAFRCDLHPGRIEDWAEIVSLCPPIAGETFAVPLYRLRTWLRSDQDVMDSIGDVEGQIENEEDSAPHTLHTPFLIYRGREKSYVSCDPDEILPDSILVLPAPRDEAGVARLRTLGQVFGERANQRRGFGAERVDVWELAIQQAGKTPTLRIHRETLAPWLAANGCVPLRELFELIETEDWKADNLRDAISRVLEWSPDDETATPLPDWLPSIFSGIANFRFNDIAQHPSGGIIIRAKPTQSAVDTLDYFADEDEAQSEALEEIALTQHSERVAQVAEAFARACLGAESASLARLASQWHDAGKLDPRFQEVLRNGIPPDANAAPLAKSPRKPRSREQAQVARETAGLPDSFRHEMLSVHLAERLCKAGRSAEDIELFLHLIGSHHGHARPFAPVCEDPAPPAVAGQLDGVAITLSTVERRSLVPLHRLNSGVGDRFWTLTRRFGWWGLAYREAILRLADWYASNHPTHANHA